MRGGEPWNREWRRDCHSTLILRENTQQSLGPVARAQRCPYTFLLLRFLGFGPQNALSGLDSPAAAVGLFPVAYAAAETPVSHRFRQ